MSQTLIASEDLQSRKGIRLKNAARKELEERGFFPRRVYLSERTYGYIESEIDAFLAEKILKRETV